MNLFIYFGIAASFYLFGMMNAAYRLGRKSKLNCGWKHELLCVWLSMFSWFTVLLILLAEKIEAVKD